MAKASTSRKQPTDGDNNPITLANAFTMTDATGTPQVSPIATGTSEIALIVPAHATRLYVYCHTQPGELRLVAGGASGGTAPIPAGVWFSIPVQAGDTVYIGRASSTVVSFVFEILAS